MRGVSSQQDGTDGLHLLADDGATWDLSREQILQMLAGSSRSQVRNAIHASLSEFLQPEEPGSQIVFDVDLLGVTSLTLHTAPPQDAGD